MRRIIGGVVLSLVLVTVVPTASAQKDRLEGRWEGSVTSFQGERRATLSFKKSGDSYTGELSGLAGTTSLPFKEIVLAGDKVTATMSVDSPQGTVAVTFDFTLEGESLKGKAELNLGGRMLAFNFDMKRVGDIVEAKTQTPRERLDYFVGEWKFERAGRESPLGPGGNMEGTLKFSNVLDGRYLESHLAGKIDGVSVQMHGFLGWDENLKAYTLFEARGSGIATLSTATWSGPGIRMESLPVAVAGQNVRLRRTISTVSATTFSMVEEFSADGGSYQRLGHGTYTKVISTSATTPK